MELKREVYSIGEAAKLLSADVGEVHRLVAENELSKCSGITAKSLQDFAARTKIELKQVSAG